MVHDQEKIGAPRIAKAGIVWMLVAQCGFAIMNVLAREGSRHLPWTEVACIRFAVGLVVAWIWVTATGGFRIVNWKASWLRAIFGTLSAVATFFALGSPRLPVGDAATLNNTAPVWVALLAWPLLGERVGKRLIFALLIAFAGVMLIVQPSFHSGFDVAMIALAGALAFGLAILSLRRLGATDRPEAIVVHFSAVVTIVMLVLAWNVLQEPTLREWLIVAGSGVAGGVGQIAMTRSYKALEATPAAALSYTQALFTYLLASLAFGDAITAAQIGGAILVGGGGWLATMRKGRA